MLPLYNTVPFLAAAREKYSIRLKMKAWEKIFNNVLSGEKKKRVWDKQKFNTGSAIVKLSQSNSQWYSNNKEDVRQYLRIFPEDPILLAWEKLLR